MELSIVKRYLRIELDNEDDDEMLQGFIYSAEEYIKNATGKVFDAENSLYNMAVKLLVSHWYENKSATAERAVVELPFSLNQILIQLALCGDYVQAE